MSVFFHAQGIKTVQAGCGVKNGKIQSTQLLNDPYQNIESILHTTYVVPDITQKPCFLRWKKRELCPIKNV